MTFEWDTTKNDSNEKKHGIDFGTAQRIFDDPRCVCFVERFDRGEERWHAIGMIEDIILVVVGIRTES